MSYWDHQKPVFRARAVNVADVARACVKLLDEGGLKAVTVRAVAGRLGVAPASLYSRVESVDDLFDLALDSALEADADVAETVIGTDLDALALAYFRHLVRHRWACQVIGMRAPRGPNYLRLSERMCVLLAAETVRDPLEAAYLVANFVIGSATTAPMADSESAAAVDPDIAPLYAHLHTGHVVDAELLFRTGLAALRTHIGVQ